MSAPSPSSSRLALLIDAENVSGAQADVILAAAAKLGTPGVRRVYGDFCHGSLKAWCEAVPRLGLSPQQQFGAGKNAADIALVIDAMDLLHSGGIDAFCLVTSDSDFTRLALRLREGGARVTLIGESKAKESFRAACDRFIDIGGLTPDAAPVAKAAKSAAPAKPKSVPVLPNAAFAGALLKEAVKQAAGEDGWITLSQLGQTLRQRQNGATPPDYKSGSLAKLCGKVGDLEVGAIGGHPARVRLRTPATT